MFLFNRLSSLTIIHILSFFKPQELCSLYNYYKTKYSCEGDIVDDKIFTVLLQDTFWEKRCEEDFTDLRRDTVMIIGTYDGFYVHLYERWKKNLRSKLKHKNRKDGLDSILKDFHRIPYDDEFFQDKIISNYVGDCFYTMGLKPEDISLLDDLLNFKVIIDVNNIGHRHVDKIYFNKLLTRIDHRGDYGNMLRIKSSWLYLILNHYNLDEAVPRFVIICKSLLEELVNVDDHDFKFMSVYFTAIRKIVTSVNLEDNHYKEWLSLIIDTLNVMPDKYRALSIEMTIKDLVVSPKNCKDGTELVVNRLLYHPKLTYTPNIKIRFPDFIHQEVEIEWDEVISKYEASHNQ